MATSSRTLREYAKEVIYIEDRETLFKKTRDRRAELNVKLKAAFRAVPAFARQLGLEFGDDFDPAEDKFEVHSLRSSMRVTTDGRYVPQVVVVLTQAKKIAEVASAGGRLPKFRGGSTLVVDLTTPMRSSTESSKTSRTALGSEARPPSCSQPWPTHCARCSLRRQEMSIFSRCIRWSTKESSVARRRSPRRNVPALGRAVEGPDAILVGSGTGAVTRRPLLGRIRGFPLRARVEGAVVPSPVPAASHVACGFTALRVPALLHGKGYEAVPVERRPSDG
jgi:hypothetical protein